MQANNRVANHASMQYAKEHYGLDEYIVNDQGFDEIDFREGWTYIGHHKEGQGFTKARNQLLKWFYNSDADYAMWIDANSKVSKSTLNDLRTLVDVVKRGDLEVDVVFSTLGMYLSGLRIEARQQKDHKENIHLIKAGGCDWFHAMFMINFKKYYDLELYIDDRCDPRKGTSEDIYFARLLLKLANCRVCPTIIVGKPSNKTSTWIAEKDGYKYTPVDYTLLQAYIDENIKKLHLVPLERTNKHYMYDRVDIYKELVKSYVPPKRPKKGLI